MLISIHLKKKLIYILVFLLTYVVKYIFIEKIPSNIIALTSIISQISFIFIFFLQKYLSRKKGENKNESDEFIFNKKENPNKIQFSQLKNKIILIICSTMLNIMNCYLNERWRFIYDSYMYIKIFILLYFYKFLGMEIFNHHKLSIILNVIISLILIIIYFDHLREKFVFLPILFYDNYCYSLYLFLIKFLNTKYFVDLFLVQSIQGFSFLIYKIITKYDFFSGSTNCFLIIICIIYHFIFIYLLLIIIEKLDPIHAIISYLIGEMFIYSDFMKKKKIVLFILIYGTFTISNLIYIEIIQLNFWGLNENTKRNILKRSEMHNIDNVDNIDSSLKSDSSINQSSEVES